MRETPAQYVARRKREFRAQVKGYGMATLKDNSNEPMSRQEKRLFTLAVGRYLSAINATMKSRNLDALESELNEVVLKLAEPSLTPVKRLELIQARLELQEEMASAQEATELETLQKEFVTRARVWSAERGISYAAWREMGVPKDVLVEAGIT